MCVWVIQGDIVDVICYCVYGCIVGVIEVVLVVNLGIVDFGFVLLYGIEFVMFDIFLQLVM